MKYAVPDPFSGERHVAFKHACFISYCRPQHELLKGFIGQLKRALDAELESYLDEKVFIDDVDVGPGDKHAEVLARAICESVCMIVVWSPRYDRHPYCLREFEAMRMIEERRRQLLGPSRAHGTGFIVSVIVRGADAVPDRIRQQDTYCDFSTFTLAMPDIIRNPEYVNSVRGIAAKIHRLYDLFQTSNLDPCGSCLEFTLPPAPAPAPYLPAFVNR
jgi:hypothetical protein